MSSLDTELSVTGAAGDESPETETTPAPASVASPVSQLGSAPFLPVLRTPADGLAFSVVAGEKVALTFEFFNEAPFARLFHLEAEQQPTVDDFSWCHPADAARLGAHNDEDDEDVPQTLAVPQVTVAPSSGGVLACIVSPPDTAPVGEYQLQIHVRSYDDETVLARLLVLRVTPSRRPAAPRPSSQPEPASPPTTPSVTPEGTNVSVPVPSVAPEQPIRPSATGTAPTDARPEVSHVSPVANIPPPRPVAPILTDLDDTPVDSLPANVDMGGAVARIGELVADNPIENTVLPVRPGETMLLRFGFTNEGTGTRTYVIDEDRSLPADWISLVQDQVNLSRHGSGAVAVRLAPPTDAEPGDYPFMVRVGPLGGTLTPRNLTLAVQALPAVRLEAKQRALTVGPWTNDLQFHLLTNRAGNCDTAFRIGVRPVMDAATVEPGQNARPETAEDTPPENHTGGTRFEREAVYETDNWRYLFDRELGSLRSPTAQRMPPPENIHLRVQRKGIWWFGFKESHHVQVQAVPVTDPFNSGKAGNRVELSVTRWRPYPVPGWLLASLLLLALPLLGGRVDNFVVTNGLTYNGSGNWYVLEEKGKEDPAKAATALSARLRWQAPWYAIEFLRATANRKTTALRLKSGAAETVSVDGYGYDRAYEIGPLLGRDNNARLIARFVPVRTDNKLTVEADTGTRSVSQVHTPLAIGDDAQPIEGGATETTLEVPRNGQAARLLLKNRVPARQGLNINVWLAQSPQGFSIEGLNPDTNETSNNQILPEATKFVKIRYTGADAEVGGQTLPEMTLITTDKQHQVIRVKLKLVP